MTMPIPIGPIRHAPATSSGVDLGILRGGGVQVHGNFHILTSKKKTSGGG